MSSQWIHSSPANAGQVPVVTSILKDFSAEALGELRTWLEQNPPAVTIASIIGFQQFTVQVATSVFDDQSTTSTSYTNLATVGPVLTGIPDGKYVIFFGASVSTSVAGQFAYMGVKVNTTEATEVESVVCGTGTVDGPAPGFGVTVAQLSNGGNNTVTARYKSSVGTATARFLARRMVAIRISN